MTLKVELDGLDKFRQRFSGKRIQSKAAQQIGKAAILIHSELRSGVAKKYAVKQSLDRVLKGKSISQVKFGKNTLENELTYLFEPIKLSKFPHQETKVPANTAYLVDLGETKSGKKIIVKRKKDYAIETSVQVIRGSYSTVHGRKGYGGFYQPGGTGKQSGATYQRGIYERQQKATWTETLFERAPIKPLWGPTLSQMAATVFEEDEAIQNIIRKFPDFIAEGFDL